MIAAVAILIALGGWAVAVAVVVLGGNERRELRAAYERTQEADRALVSDLVMQVQVNAQGLPHYPQIGPMPEATQRNILTDDTGLIEVEFDPDEDSDFLAVGDL